jgi:hypothetical protein
LDLVRTANPTAEVLVTSADLALTCFANSFIHQNIEESTITIRFRLHTEGRTAAGSTTVGDTDGLRALVDRTFAAADSARRIPSGPAWRRPHRSPSPLRSTRRRRTPSQTPGRRGCATS